MHVALESHCFPRLFRLQVAAPSPSVASRLSVFASSRADRGGGGGAIGWRGSGVDVRCSGTHDLPMVLCFSLPLRCCDYELFVADRVSAGESVGGCLVGSEGFRDKAGSRFAGSCSVPGYRLCQINGSTCQWYVVDLLFG